MWSMRGGYGGNPRLEQYEQSATVGLNRWLVRHPFLTPIIGFTLAGVLVAISYFTGRPWGGFSRIGIFILIGSVILLVYGLLRKAIDVAERRKQGEELFPEEPMKVDERARRQAVKKWRERARREAEEISMGKGPIK